MKKIPFIALGLVLLAAIVGIVLWANMPTTKLAVHVVRPMGPKIISTNSTGEVTRMQIWEVAITNRGRAPAGYFTTLLLKEGGRVTDPNASAKGRMLPFNVQPGKQNITYELTPADSTVTWTVEVRYKTRMNGLEQKLSSWLKPVPFLRRLLPNNGEHSARAAWYVGTNVATNN
jgi:hypothetical protein